MYSGLLLSAQACRLSDLLRSLHALSHVKAGKHSFLSMIERNGLRARWPRYLSGRGNIRNLSRAHCSIAFIATDIVVNIAL